MDNKKKKLQEDDILGLFTSSKFNNNKQPVPFIDKDEPELAQT